LAWLWVFCFRGCSRRSSRRLGPREFGLWGLNIVCECRGRRLLGLRFFRLWCTRWRCGFFATQTSSGFVWIRWHLGFFFVLKGRFGCGVCLGRIGIRWSCGRRSLFHWIRRICLVGGIGCMRRGIVVGVRQKMVRRLLSPYCHLNSKVCVSNI